MPVQMRKQMRMNVSPYVVIPEQMRIQLSPPVVIPVQMRIRLFPHVIIPVQMRIKLFPQVALLLRCAHVACLTLQKLISSEERVDGFRP